MEYTIKRIALGSALRFGLALGWLVALFPSLALGWLAVVVLGRLNAAFGEIAPFELNLLGQTIARFDPLQVFGLSGLAQGVARLVGNGLLTFIMIVVVLTLAGAAIFVVTLLVACMCYNLLAAVTGGLRVELEAP